MKHGRSSLTALMPVALEARGRSEFAPAEPTFTYN
jgi:hypothetical protein